MANKMNDYIIGGAIAIGAYLVADYFGIINQIKAAIMPSQSRVSYYRPNAYNAGIGDSFGTQQARALIGEAYNFGTSSQAGDYNSIPRTEF
jgi:hypothetical protein